MGFFIFLLFIAIVVITITTNRTISKQRDELNHLRHQTNYILSYLAGSSDNPQAKQYLQSIAQPRFPAPQPIPPAGVRYPVGGVQQVPVPTPVQSVPRPNPAPRVPQPYPVQPVPVRAPVQFPGYPQQPPPPVPAKPKTTKQTPGRMENWVGRNVLGVAASVLIFIGLIFLGVLVYKYITDDIKIHM